MAFFVCIACAFVTVAQAQALPAPEPKHAFPNAPGWKWLLEPMEAQSSFSGGVAVMVDRDATKAFVAYVALGGDTLRLITSTAWSSLTERESAMICLPRLGLVLRTLLRSGLRYLQRSLDIDGVCHESGPTCKMRRRIDLFCARPCHTKCIAMKELGRSRLRGFWIASRTWESLLLAEREGRDFETVGLGLSEV